MRPLLFFTLIGLLFWSNLSAQKVLQGDFWKKQALQNIIPAWQNHVYNTQNGGFHAHLEQDWTPNGQNRQYPGMISRHLFSFSAAYLMSGNPVYLKDARNVYHYLVENGWDETHGGWYNELNQKGEVVDSSKDLFMQTYAITGLAMYHTVTRNPSALSYLEKSYNILQKHAWDSVNQGYYRALNGDLSVSNPQKDFSPQLAPASGFLTYLYPATGEKQYLDQMQTILEMAWKHMRHPTEPWIMESFDEKWQMINGQNEAMNVGHNLEVVWLLLRLYHMTDDVTFKQHALELTYPLNSQSFDPNTGAWYHHLPVNHPKRDEHQPVWWVQAYGNMTQLYLYKVTGAEQYLENFRKGAEYWNKAFIDEQYGGTFLKTKLDGSTLKGAKAVRTKTSYHAIEHGLLNFLYLNLWVNKEPVNLHYQLTHTKEGSTFHPSILADTAVVIQSVMINGEQWKEYDAKTNTIQLPGAEHLTIKVTLESTQP